MKMNRSEYNALKEEFETVKANKESILSKYNEQLTDLRVKRGTLKAGINYGMAFEEYEKKNKELEELDAKIKALEEYVKNSEKTFIVKELDKKLNIVSKEFKKIDDDNLREVLKVARDLEAKCLDIINVQKEYDAVIVGAKHLNVFNNYYGVSNAVAYQILAQARTMINTCKINGIE